MARIYTVSSFEFPSPHIFVFGSNLAGRHGKGAAKTALEVYGAEYGEGWGRTGSAYAIPTKDAKLAQLPLSRIKHYADTFRTYALFSPDLEFYITPVGTGLAGYRHEEIGPLFTKLPSNCWVCEEWGQWA